MPKTKDELIEQALRSLGVAEAGQPIEIEDYEAVDACVEPLRAMLARDRAIYIANVDAIDEAVFLPLARLLANEAAPAFGRERTQDAYEAGRAEIKRILSQDTVFHPVPTSYF